MTLPPEILEHLRACDHHVLARECDDRFPVAELEEAARSGVASLDLEEWLVRHRQVAMSDPEHHPETYGQQAPSSGKEAAARVTEKNYEDGPAD